MVCAVHSTSISPSLWSRRIPQYLSSTGGIRSSPGRCTISPALQLPMDMIRTYFEVKVSSPLMSYRLLAIRRMLENLKLQHELPRLSARRRNTMKARKREEREHLFLFRIICHSWIFFSLPQPQLLTYYSLPFSNWNLLLVNSLLPIPILTNSITSSSPIHTATLYYSPWSGLLYRLPYIN